MNGSQRSKILDCLKSVWQVRFAEFALIPFVSLADPIVWPLLAFLYLSADTRWSPSAHTSLLSSSVGSLLNDTVPFGVNTLTRTSLKGYHPAVSKKSSSKANCYKESCSRLWYFGAAQNLKAWQTILKRKKHRQQTKLHCQSCLHRCVGGIQTVLMKKPMFHLRNLSRKMTFTKRLPTILTMLKLWRNLHLLIDHAMIVGITAMINTTTAIVGVVTVTTTTTMTDPKAVPIVPSSVIGEAVVVATIRRNVLGIGGQWQNQHLGLAQEVGSLWHVALKPLRLFCNI